MQDLKKSLPLKMGSTVVANYKNSPLRPNPQMNQLRGAPSTDERTFDEYVCRWEEPHVGNFSSHKSIKKNLLSNIWPPESKVHWPFSLQAFIRKFWSKSGSGNRPRNLDQRVPDRNFWRANGLYLKWSPRQKFRSEALGSRIFGVFSDPNFDQNFRMNACNEKG